MPSAESAARSEEPVTSPISDEHAYREESDERKMPSETAAPTQVHEAPQQAATQPDSGTTVENQGQDQDQHEPRFKEKVIGYAKEIRGTALRKPETKERGQRIRQGTEVFEPKKVGPKA